MPSTAVVTSIILGSKRGQNSSAKPKSNAFRSVHFVECKAQSVDSEYLTFALASGKTIARTVMGVKAEKENRLWSRILLFFAQAWKYQNKNVKILNGWRSHLQTGLTVLQTLPQDQRGLYEMKNPTRLSNKTSTAWSCAEDQILENKNLREILNSCSER